MPIWLIPLLKYVALPLLEWLFSKGIYAAWQEWEWVKAVKAKDLKDEQALQSAKTDQEQRDATDNIAKDSF